MLLTAQGLDAGTLTALLLLTASPDLDTRAALLSAGQVVTLDGRVWLALWPSSHTTANLSKSGKATLLVIDESGAFRIRLSADRVQDIIVDGRTLAAFRSTIVEVEEDVVEYATLTSGIRFDLKQPDVTLAHWRQTIEAIRDLARTIDSKR